MSVVLQSFLANPYLRTHFLGDRHNRLSCDKTRAGEPCLSCELDLLFSEVRLSPSFSTSSERARLSTILTLAYSTCAQQYSVDPMPLAPTRFLHSFWQSSLDAAGYAQQDAHEFLISCASSLALRRPVRPR